jgi:hypothetical protein
MIDSSKHKGQRKRLVTAGAEEIPKKLLIQLKT